MRCRFSGTQGSSRTLSVFARGGILLGVVALIMVFRGPVAQAQLPAAPVTEVPAVGQSVGTSLTDPGSQAAWMNPSALPRLSGFRFQYLYRESPRGRDDRRGHQLGLSLPLETFGLGVSYEHEAVGGGFSRSMTALGLAFGVGDAAALGLGVRAYRSSEGLIDDLHPVDFSLSIWPTETLALTTGVRDAFGRMAHNGKRDPLGFLGVGVRPFGDERLSLSVDAYATQLKHAQLAAQLGFDAGWGRAFVSSTWPDVSEPYHLQLLAGLGLRLGGLEVLGGAEWSKAGDELGEGLGVFGGIGLGPSVGFLAPRFVRDLRVRELDARSVMALTHELDRVRRAPRAAGVLLRLEGTSPSLAYVQEIRAQIKALRKAGKRVACFLEAASGAEWMICAAANATYVDAAGFADLTGPSVTVLSLGDTARFVGVRPDFVRIGEYKSAPEQLTRGSQSEPAKQQREALLRESYAQVVRAMAEDYGVSEAEVRAVFDKGPYVAPQLVQMGWAKGVGDRLALDKVVEDAFGRAMPLRDHTPMPPRRWRNGRGVAVVVVDGDIVDGENVNLPILGRAQSGGHTVAKAIERAAKDSRVAAIVLRVDSPGGSVLASDQIWRAVARARRVKPVIASMGAVAASGGYYVASAADEIWADPSTVTGSIGVFSGKVDFAPILERLGVGIEFLSESKRAGMDSAYRPYTADERAAAAEQVRLWYRTFLRRISEGRGVSPAEVDPLARGRVWTGEAALRHGLVDHHGGFMAALSRARELTGLPADSPIAVSPDRPEGLLEWLLDDGEGGAAASLYGWALRGGRADPLPLRAASGAPQSVAELLPAEATRALIFCTTLMRSAGVVARMPDDIEIRF